jgi:hypothetical protein
LINNPWTFHDNDDAEPKTNVLTAQPFINFHFGIGWSLAFAPIITASWDAEAGGSGPSPSASGSRR